MGEQLQNFWIVLVSTAATLAGFTLASYSIFASRIESAAADTTCRRYAFKECTSEYSLAFMQFALTMFVMPLLIGVMTLFPFKTLNKSWHMPIGLVVLVLEVALSCAIAYITRKQFRYEGMYASYAKELRAHSTPGKLNRLDDARIVVAAIMLGMSCLVFFVNLWHVNAKLTLAGATLVHPDVLNKIMDALPCELAATISLFAGLALVSWYFYLFEPSRVILATDKVTTNMLEETQKNIKTSLDRIERVQKWLGERVANAKTYLDNVALEQVNNEVKFAKVLLEEAETYLKGITSGLSADDESLPKRAQYHYGWLEFCQKQKVMPFREIIRIMHGIDLFAQAVTNYEQQLKEMPQQLALLIDPLIPWDKRMEWR